jgi:G3E family GTPase
MCSFADARLLEMVLPGKPGLFHKDVEYIYFKQLEEAEILVVNKIDCLDEAALKQLVLLVEQKYGEKTILYQNSLDAGSVRRWVSLLDEEASLHANSDLEINYDIYGSGEAKLAWLDQQIEIYQPAETAISDAIELVNAIHEQIRINKYPVGHLKFLLNGDHKISFTFPGDQKASTNLDDKKTMHASLLINARVQTAPQRLTDLVNSAIKHLEDQSGCIVSVSSRSAFQPGFPIPTYRIRD